MLAQNTCAMSPLIHFTTTTAFDEHRKTLAWEQQPTDGGEDDSNHVCVNTDPGTHVLPAFMFWSIPPLLQKKVEKQWRRVGGKEKGIKKDWERKRQMKRNAGLSSGSGLWCKRNRVRAVFGSSLHMDTYVPISTHVYTHLCWHNTAKTSLCLRRLRIPGQGYQ